MKRLYGWSLTLIGLFLHAGCATIQPPAQPAPPPVPPVTRAQAELPPAKAAQVCLAAAREMEAKEHEAQAIAQYERARQYNPRLTEVSHKLALLYDRQGDSDHALAEYEGALKEHPKDADLLNDVGFFYYEHGQWTEAEKWLEKAVALNPHHARAWVNLAKVLGQQGRFNESYAAFARVLKPAEAHSNVGVMLAKQGKQEEAKQAFRQALALQPDLKQAQAILAVLENTVPAGGNNQVRSGPKEPEGVQTVVLFEGSGPSQP